VIGRSFDGCTDCRPSFEIKRSWGAVLGYENDTELVALICKMVRDGRCHDDDRHAQGIADGHAVASCNAR
jgi:hypothetical protein